MKYLRPKNSQKGIAIISVVFIITMIVWMASELTVETSVEYSIHARSVQKLQAYYAAKSGVEMSLLRLKLYKQAKAQLGDQLGPASGLLNMIWTFPLVWPPVLGEEVSSVDRESIQDTIKESQMQGSFMATISDEGSKIDVNDLASPSETIRELTKKQLVEALNLKILDDRDFAEINRQYTAEQLISLIQDWVDGDTQSGAGGDEASYYADRGWETPLPPNRAFRSLEELRMVAGMTPSLYKFLSDKVTVYGQKAINPNTAPAEVLMALDESMTQEVVQEITSRRDDIQAGGPFQNAADFWSFANSQGARVTTEKQTETPLVFDSVLAFRIRSSGEYRGNMHNIEVVVWDIDQVTSSLAGVLTEEITGKKAGDSADSTKASGNQQLQDKGPPRIVYWKEK